MGIIITSILGIIVLGYGTSLMGFTSTIFVMTLGILLVNLKPVNIVRENKK